MAGAFSLGRACYCRLAPLTLRLMPILHLVDPARQSVRTTVTGEITVDDILRHLEDARREETLDYKELIDASGVTPPFLSSGEIWQAARRVSTLMTTRRCGPRAVVVNNMITFGLTRIFATLVGDAFPMNVFRDASRAEAWLADWSRPS